MHADYSECLIKRFKLCKTIASFVHVLSLIATLHYQIKLIKNFLIKAQSYSIEMKKIVQSLRNKCVEMKIFYGSNVLQLFLLDSKHKIVQRKNVSLKSIFNEFWFQT